MEVVTGIVGILRRWGQSLAPYLMLEILLPGGTLIALLLFLYRRSALTATLAKGPRSPDVELGPARTTIGERVLNRRLP